MGERGGFRTPPSLVDLSEDPEVQEAVDDACERWENAGRAWDAVTWCIANDHLIGRAVTSSGQTRVLEVEGTIADDEPTIFVVYELELPNAIRLRRVKFQDPTISQSGRA